MFLIFARYCILYSAIPLSSRMCV